MLQILTRFPDTNRNGKLVIPNEFEKNRDDMVKINVDYNSELSFFESFSELRKKSDNPSLLVFGDCENSAYADVVVNSKNVYLAHTVTFTSENVLYSLTVKQNCRNILNSVMVYDSCENIYFCNGITQSLNIFYSKFIHNSSDIWFSENLIGCHNCVFCSDLENKSYCIKNKQYTKEEFLSLKNDILKGKSDFFKFFLNLHEKGKNYGSSNAIGEFNLLGENIKNSYFTYQIKNANNTMMIGSKEGNKEMYDVFLGGAGVSNNFYGIQGAGGCEDIFCSIELSFSSHIYYSYFLENCSYCLGCIGLKNKSFCILNKQYTKEERFELVNKIFEKMNSDGTLGQFFPASMNPFYFNDTVAYLIDPDGLGAGDSFTKEEVTKEGYLRRDEKIKVDIPANAEIVYANPSGSFVATSPYQGRLKLSDFQGFDSSGNWKINPEIIKKVIVDEQGNYYTIQKMELEFLQKYGLPLPEIHWLDRIKLGFRFK